MTKAQTPATPGKATIYVDIEDEITSIIDKVVSSDQKIVALVLPKRASALQSIVNMRLLKRSADSAKKKIVLITSEASLMPLAGIAGLHVAKSLQSKPEVPQAPDSLPTDEGVDDLSDPDEEEESEDGPDLAAPVGALAAAGAVAAAKADDTETIDLDDDDEPEGDASVDAAKEEKAAKTPKDKTPKVPNFDRFRILLIVGGVLLLAIIILGFFGLRILPKATITINTDSVPVSAQLTVKTSSKATTVDVEKNIMPSVLKTSKQTGTQKVPATGTKDLGTKATGTLTLTNCINDGVSHTISSGTGFSSGDKTFITDTAVTLDPALYSGSNCKSAAFGLSKTVSVTAISAGDSYNVSAGTFTTPASLTTSNGSVTAKGSDMTGGTTNIAKVVAQSDIDAAKAKITTTQTAAGDAFKKQLNDSGLYTFEETFTTSTPVVTSSPNLGEAATDVTVTQTVTYSVLTVQQSDFEKLINAALVKQINPKEQKISDDDVLNKAVVRVTDKASDTDITASVHKDSTAIPIIDETEVKTATAGMKDGDVKDTLGTRPGVKSVEVSFSPFWVNKVPKNASKVTVIIKPADGGGSGN